MTLDEALKCSDEGTTGSDEDVIEVLAAEARRLQAENTALRLYAPAQRAGKMSAPVRIATTRWPRWGIVGIVQETDEEFSAKGRVYVEITR